METPKVLAKNMEKYLSFSIGNLHFKDSLQFLNSSLDKLVKNALGKEKDYSIMKNLRQYFDREWRNLDKEAFVMLTRKGLYTYSYMDSLARFEETSLPPRQSFFNDLTNKDITDEDHDFIHKLWKKFELKNLGELHNLYVETDTLLLFRRFRRLSKMFSGKLPIGSCSLLHCTRSKLDGSIKIYRGSSNNPNLS